MAIAFDNALANYSGSSVASPYTLSYTMGSVSNGLLLVSAIGSTVVVTGMTYNGVAMTSAGSASLFGNTEYLYYMYAPGSGANNIVVTFTGGSSDIDVHVASYSGVAQSSFPDASSFTTTHTGTPLTYTLTVSANAWMWSTGRNTSQGPLTAGTNVTGRGTQGTGYLNMGDSNGPFSAGSQTQTWTGSSGTASYGGIVVSFVPAGTTTVNSGFFFAVDR